LALYWKVEFRNLLPHLVCFSVLVLLLHNMRIQFCTVVCCEGYQLMICIFDCGTSSLSTSRMVP